MLSCVTSLYILDINPLLGILFANIFSSSVGGLFILPIVSFHCAKDFSFEIVPFAYFLPLFPLPEETYPK